MDAVLTNNGIMIIDDDAREYFGPNYQKLINKLTIRTKQRVGPDKIAKVYKYDTVDGIKVLILPRMMMASMKQSSVIKSIENTIVAPAQINLEFDGEIYDNQKVVLDKLFKDVYTPENVASGTACCVLNLRAGQGKTFVASGCMKEIKMPTLYIVPTKELQKQAYKDLKSSFPGARILKPDGTKLEKVKKVKTAKTVKLVKTAKTAKVKKTNIENTENLEPAIEQEAIPTPPVTYDTADVVIMVINSALNMPDSFFRRFGFTIMDEIHTYCADKRSKIFWKAQSTYVLGMSATTNNRLDGFDQIYYKHLGTVIEADKIPGFNLDGSEFKGFIKEVKYSGSPEYTKHMTSPATGTMFVPDMIKQFIADPDRNKLIVDEVMLMVAENRNIFVFSESRNHLEILQNLLLAEFKKISDVQADAAPIYAPELQEDPEQGAKPRQDIPESKQDVSLMRGGIKDNERELANKARIILTTYGYSGTGVSIPKMDSALFATPRKHGYIQICARIQRRGGNMEVVRKIVDIVDCKTKMKNQYYTRKLAYEFYKFPVHKAKKTK